MNIPTFTMPPFPSLNLSLIVNLPVLIIFFGLFLFFYAIVTSVLVYHWNTYGMRNQGILVGETLFFLVAGFLFLCALVSLFYY